MIRTFLKLLTLLLPWPLRRRILTSLFGYELHPTSRIGLSWVFPEKLVLEEKASIGSLTVCKHLSLLHLKSHATIGRGNWITGFPPGHAKHFAHQPGRSPQLIVEEHAAITHRHLIDCTHRVEIGRFSTLAGFQSQILSHSIDLEHCRQSSAPVRIGDYCFVGTNSVILGGSTLPSHSVLGAKSLLNKVYENEYSLYAGVPARELKKLDRNLPYFTRAIGFVD
jgi:acetyltransferase-like isoleucine patch superfamily enzyme